MKAKHHLFIAAALCACIALAACTGDANEPATGQRTPLVITAGVAAPAATYANTVNNQWTADDWVAVEMNDVVKRYLVSATGTMVTLSPADAENTHYLPNGSFTVRAWRYGHTEPFTENFAWNYKPAKWKTWSAQNSTIEGESGYQKADFLYAPELTVGNSAVSGGNVGLTFYHQTARVVVNVREDGAVKAENKGKIKVGIGAPVTETTGNLSLIGTFDAGLIDPANGKYSGLTGDPTVELSTLDAKPIVPANEGYACSFEALVIPQNMSEQDFIQVVIPELYPDNPTPSPETGTYIYTAGPNEADLFGGYTYTYDITVSENGTLHVTASTPIAGWGPEEDAGSGTAHEEVIPLDGIMTEINDNRTYLLTGTKENVQDLLKITGGTPTIILRDLDIKGKYPIVIDNSTPTFKVEGENRIIATAGPAICLNGETANVRIIGDGRDNNRLTVESMSSTSGGYPAIGDVKGICGSISLSDITLIASGNFNTDTSVSAAVIGLSGDATLGRKCGPITITNCHVEATAGGAGAAAIGFGYCDRYDENSTHKMGDITITNTILKCTVAKDPNGVWPAHIGGSSNGLGQYSVGKITITPPEGTGGTEFFQDFTKGDGSAMLDNEVIVGFPEGAKPTNGAEFDIYWDHHLLGPVIRWSDRGGLQ